MKEVLIVIWLHFIADFLFQTRRVGVGKGSNILILLEHVVLYSVPFWIVFGFKYAAINAALHFIVDFFSSKATSYFWSRDNKYGFFSTIGLDQALHLTCLVLTLEV